MCFFVELDINFSVKISSRLDEKNLLKIRELQILKFFGTENSNHFVAEIEPGDVILIFVTKWAIRIQKRVNQGCQYRHLVDDPYQERNQRKRISLSIMFQIKRYDGTTYDS